MASGYLQNKQKLKGIRRMLFAVAVINALCMVILSYAASFFDSSFPIYIQSLIVGFLAYMIPILLYSFANGITVSVAKERFSLKPCKATSLLLVGLSGVCFQFVMVVVNLPVNLLVGNSGTYYHMSVYELIAAIFIIAAMPAFFEEFLFRGIVYGSMAEFNEKAAAIFSSVMFALLHADLHGIVGYLLMGFVLAFVIKRTGSLYSAMLFHFANNITALLLEFFNSELIYAPVTTIALFVAGVIGFLLTVVGIMLVCPKKASVNKIKTSVLVGQSFINIPIILCAAAVILTAVITRNI